MWQILLNSEPTDDNQVETKPYVGFSSEKDRKRRDLSTVFNDQENDFVNNTSTILDSITFNGNPTTDN